MIVKLLGAIVVGGVVGSVLLCVLRLVQDLLLHPPEMGDGQYPLMFVSLLLAGAILGAATVTGAVCEWSQFRGAAAAVWRATGLVIGAVCLVGYGGGDPGERLRNLLVYGGLPLMWAGSLILAAVRVA